MLARMAADAVLLLHLAFIAFAIFGGLLVISRPWLAWLHLPAVFWAGWVVIANYACPLTAIENNLRHAGGQSGYHGGFIEHYLLPLIYPSGLTTTTQTQIGLLFALWNVVVYGTVLRRMRRRA